MGEGDAEHEPEGRDDERAEAQPHRSPLRRSPANEVGPQAVPRDGEDRQRDRHRQEGGVRPREGATREEAPQAGGHEDRRQGHRDRVDGVPDEQGQLLHQRDLDGHETDAHREEVAERRADRRPGLHPRPAPQREQEEQRGQQRGDGELDEDEEGVALHLGGRRVEQLARSGPVQEAVEVEEVGPVVEDRVDAAGHGGLEGRLVVRTHEGLNHAAADPARPMVQAHARALDVGLEARQLLGGERHLPTEHRGEVAGVDHRHALLEARRGDAPPGLVHHAQEAQHLDLAGQARHLDRSLGTGHCEHVPQRLDRVEEVLGQHVGPAGEGGPGVDPRHLEQVEALGLSQQRRTPLRVDDLDPRPLQQRPRALGEHLLVEVDDLPVELHRLDATRPALDRAPEIGSATGADDEHGLRGEHLGAEPVEGEAQVGEALGRAREVVQERAGAGVLRDEQLLLGVVRHDRPVHEHAALLGGDPVDVHARQGAPARVDLLVAQPYALAALVADLVRGRDGEGLLRDGGRRQGQHAHAADQAPEARAVHGEHRARGQEGRGAGRGPRGAEAPEQQRAEHRPHRSAGQVPGVGPVDASGVHREQVPDHQTAGEERERCAQVVEHERREAREGIDAQVRVDREAHHPEVRERQAHQGGDGEAGEPAIGRRGDPRTQGEQERARRPHAQQPVGDDQEAVVEREAQSAQARDQHLPQERGGRHEGEDREVPGQRAPRRGDGDRRAGPRGAGRHGVVPSAASLEPAASGAARSSGGQKGSLQVGGSAGQRRHSPDRRPSSMRPRSARPRFGW